MSCHPSLGTFIFTCPPHGQMSSDGIVRVTDAFLGGIVAAAFARPDDPAPTGSSTGTAGGRGAAPGAGRRPTPAPRDRIRVVATGDAAVDELDGRVVLVQDFTVSGPGPASLRAEVSVGLGERSREDEAPAGASRPEVLHWTTADGTYRGDTLVVGSPAEVRLVVLPVPDTLTDISVVGERVEGST